MSPIFGKFCITEGLGVNIDGRSTFPACFIAIVDSTQWHRKFRRKLCERRPRVQEKSSYTQEGKMQMKNVFKIYWDRLGTQMLCGILYVIGSYLYKCCLFYKQTSMYPDPEVI